MGRALLALALAAGALVLPSPAAADITATPAARGVFTLERNGVLDVLERVSVIADAPTAATWQVTMQRGELFAQPSLYVDGRRYRPGDGKRSETFRISRGSRGVRFDWLQPHGTHTARLGYRLALFGTAYTDVVDLHVPVWESGWPVDVGTLVRRWSCRAFHAGTRSSGSSRATKTPRSRRPAARSACRLATSAPATR